MGRRTRLVPAGAPRLWPVFASVRKAIGDRRLMTPAWLFATLTKHYGARPEKPFTHIIVDEAQDLGIAELRFLVAIAPATADALFFAGGLGQRIFQPPFSWKGIGIRRARPLVHAARQLSDFTPDSHRSRSSAGKEHRQGPRIPRGCRDGLRRAGDPSAATHC
jgi:hypothetical protein